MALRIVDILHSEVQASLNGHRWVHIWVEKTIRCADVEQ